MKFVAQNRTGFSNSWEVLAFTNDHHAMEYIQKTRIQDQPAGHQPRIIPKRDIGHWLGARPKPFSGECFILINEENAPYDGYVTIGLPEHGERIFK